MPLHVEREVVGARERALADGTLERFGTRVFAVVACELVRPREPPFTLRPLASVRLFTCTSYTVISPPSSIRMRNRSAYPEQSIDMLNDGSLIILNQEMKNIVKAFVPTVA